jgi:hypothetical protein
MITSARLLYVAVGAVLAVLGVVLPRLLFTLIFVVAFTVFIEPRLPYGAKDVKENKLDQAAFLIGGILVIAIALAVRLL